MKKSWWVFFENPIHKIFLPANLVSGTFYRLFWIPSTTYRKDRRGKLSVLWVLCVLCVYMSDSSVHYPKDISFYLSTPAIQKSNTGTGSGKGVSIDNHHWRKKTISRKAKLVSHSIFSNPYFNHWRGCGNKSNSSTRSTVSTPGSLYIHYQIIMLPSYHVTKFTYVYIHCTVPTTPLYRI